MVTVLGDEMVGVAGVLRRQLLHQTPHLLRPQIRPSYQNRFPEAESCALFRLPFEDPSRRILVRTECVLHLMNLNAGVVDPEAKPVSVAVDWGQIVDVQIHWYRSRLSLSPKSSDEHFHLLLLLCRRIW